METIVVTTLIMVGDFIINVNNVKYMEIIGVALVIMWIALMLYVGIMLDIASTRAVLGC